MKFSNNSLKLPLRKELPYLRVAFLLCPSFTLTPVACFVDALRLAADQHDFSRQIYFEWQFISVSSNSVKSSCGLMISTLSDNLNIDDFDCVVVCGGLLSEIDQVNDSAYEYLRISNSKGIPIIGLCTGSFVLARAGLLENRRCTLPIKILAEFTASFPNAIPVTNKNFIIEDNIITCPGSIAALDLATYIIEYYSNNLRAQKAKDYLLYDSEESRIKIINKPYDEALGLSSQLTKDAVYLMEFNIDSPCSIEKLAKTLKTTKQKLYRAFYRDLTKTPSKFWLELKLNTAAELLQRQRRTITEIAYETGFSDAAHFCKHFKKYFSVTPLTYRNQFTRDLNL